MKLLLDEMWSALVAVQLRARGHDVVAVTERPDLRGKSDELVFALAQTESRVLVTDNVADYRPLLARAIQGGHAHPGVVFTTNRRFPRGDPRTVGRIVLALHELLEESPSLAHREFWLE